MNPTDLKLKYLANKENLANFCLILGSYNLIFIVSMLIVSTVFFFLKFSISFYVVIISLVVSTIWCCWASKRYFREKDLEHSSVFILLLFIFFITLYSCIVISGSFFDLSWDGQAYHQETVIQLMNGWNPIYSNVGEVPHSIWIDHYSKGAEINAAALSTVTRSIEECKAINIFLIITTFLIAFAAIILTSDTIKLRYAFVLGFLISMNPVSTSQSLSFYVDGQLASAISCFLCLILLLSKRVDTFVLMSLFSTIIILINLKFLGVIYVLIFSLGLIYWSFTYKREKLILISKYLFFSLLIGLLIVGYNPYVTNTVNDGNPFYPLIGSNIDIMTRNTPPNLLNTNSFENLFSSIFSHPTVGIKDCEYKIPFIFSIEDLKAFRATDVRTSGFGPLFSGAIIICLLNLLGLLKTKKSIMLNNPDISIKLLILLSLFISVLINPQSWWARYVPQLWLIPIFSLFFTLNIKTKIFKYSNYFLILILVINALLVSSVYVYYQMKNTENLNDEMNSLSSLNNGEIKVHFSNFYSNRVRLDERGIEYEEVPQLNISPSLELGWSDTQIYVINNSSYGSLI
jgi:hypothetical protein